MTDTPAGELREAARLMRERAGAVPQDWELVRTQIVAVGTDRMPGTDIIGECMVAARAAYVASMAPPVALAVADWLAAAAAHALAGGDGCPGCVPYHALAVARAYLGTAEGSPS